MAKPELTKQLMANTLKSLMQAVPLDKINVQDIVRACGLNRKTFYYHFRDKQELICWIFDKEFADLKDWNRNNTIIDELVDHLRSNKDFYSAALTSDAQNNLREHFFQVIYNGILSDIKRILGIQRMKYEDMKTTATYFTHAVIGSITQWAKEGMETSLMENSVNFHSLTRDCLQYIITEQVGK